MWERSDGSLLRALSLSAYPLVLPRCGFTLTLICNFFGDRCDASRADSFKSARIVVLSSLQLAATMTAQFTASKLVVVFSRQPSPRDEMWSNLLWLLYMCPRMRS